MQQIAAKAILLDSQGRVLVLQQSGEKTVQNAGRYHVPGGMVEYGESVETALLREVKEETGLDVVVGELLGVYDWQATIRGVQTQIFGVFYKCRCKDDSANIVWSSEHQAYTWVENVSELAKLEVLEPADELICQVFARVSTKT